ncbi:MAG: hypothetical protein WBJ84_00055 [Bacteroidales bacterium]
MVGSYGSIALVKQRSGRATGAPEQPEKSERRTYVERRVMRYLNKRSPGQVRPVFRSVWIAVQWA